MGKRGPSTSAPTTQRVRLAIVSADFNQDVTGPMRQRALKEAKAQGALIVLDVTVPGSYDLPLIVDEALRRPDVDAAVAIGAIVAGETGHDEIIGHAVAKQLLESAIAHRKPVGMGVTGPRQTYDQALARIDRADWAVRSAINQFTTLGAVRRPDGRAA